MEFVLRLSLLTFAVVCCLLAIASNQYGITLVKASHQVFRELKCDEVEQVHRSRYHYQPEKHWIGDPSAPMYYNGMYHIFYQYNPKAALWLWGDIVWGHAVSKDLINWVELPVALYPSKDFDIQGCWTGSATIIPSNRPVIFYTGVNSEGLQIQNYAIPANYSDPYLIEWHKPDDNPVIYPTGVNGSAFRDPSTAWFGGGHWKTLLASRRSHRGIVYLYRSRDFMHWTKAKHPFYSTPMSDMLEAPDLFAVSKLSKKGVADTSLSGECFKHILKISYDNKKFDYYFVGTYFPNKDNFMLDDPTQNEWNALRFDYGKYYASKTFFDSNKNRRILWGWANEANPIHVDLQKGWSGIQAIPRVLWLDTNGKQLRQWPIEELNELRMRKVQIRDVILEQDEHVEIKGITPAQADVDVVFSFSSLDMAEQFNDTWVTAQSICSQKGSSVPGGVGPFGLLTLASKKLEEYTPIFFRIFKTNNTMHKVVMCCDSTRSSLVDEYEKYVYGGFVDVDLSDRKLSLRTLIDHSMVESFGADGRTCMIIRAYPTLAISNNARLLVFNNGTQPISVTELSAWSMRNATINKLIIN